MTAFFHRTTRASADAILATGFKDATGHYGTRNQYTGVWISNEPLDMNEGASGDVLLVVEIDPALIEAYEWVEERKPYREFLVPAEVLNSDATLTPRSDEDYDRFPVIDDPDPTGV